MKKSSVVLKWGIITSVVMCVYSYLLYVTNAAFTMRSLSYLSIVIMVGGLAMGMIEFRNKVNGGFATFGKQFGLGMLMTLIIAAISTIYFEVLVASTPYMDNMLAQSQAEMVNKGMSSEQIEMGMKYAKMFMSPVLMGVFGLIGNAIMGAIASLIAAAITSKAAPIGGDNNSIPA